MPYAPELSDALEAQVRSRLPWSSAPMLPFLLSTSPPGAPDFFDGLPALDTWYSSTQAASQQGEVQSGGKLCSRDELCETADARKAELKTPEQESKQRPRLLVCHDFQGGYNDDPRRRGYTFEYWSLADVFIYFSHRRISCPPAGWNAAAQRHGCKMLGTVIFEWKEAMPELSLLLRGPHDLYSPLKPPLRFSPYYIPALIELALSNIFSGWLINIELPLDLGFQVSGYTWYPDWLRPTSAATKADMASNARRLRAWVALLRSEGRRRFALAGRDPNEWTVLWYDSVTREGQLRWQDAVTVENVDFLEVSDGIFTNYTWARPDRPHIQQPDMPGGPSPSTDILAAHEAEAKREASRLLAESTPHPALAHSVAILDKARRLRADAWIGIDVFGRSCWGGSQTWRSLEMIGSAARWRARLGPAGDASSQVARLGLSVALFGPGWTWEHAEPGTLTAPSSSANHQPEDGERRTWAEFAELDRRFWTGARPSSSSVSTGIKLSSEAAHEEAAFRFGLNAYFPPRASALLGSQRSASDGASGSVFYHTTFARGSGMAWYNQGKPVAKWQATPSEGHHGTEAEALRPAGDASKDDEAHRARQEAIEQRARARVLVGWTDAGTTLPKADATWPQPSCVWVGGVESSDLPRDRADIAADGRSSLASISGDAVPEVAAELVEDRVWAGNCSLQVQVVRLPHQAPQGRRALFIPIAWVPGPPDETPDVSVQAAAVLALGPASVSIDAVGLALRTVDGQVIQSDQTSTAATETAEWSRVSATFSLRQADAAASTPHPSIRPQVILGLLVAEDKQTVQHATLEIYVGELSLRTPGMSTYGLPAPAPVSVAHKVEIVNGADGLASLTWPDFVPQAHFYEVFAARAARHHSSSLPREEPVWLGTATRERSKTAFVIPLGAVRAALSLSNTGEEDGWTAIVWPHGSCWGEACAESGRLSFS
ncbi:hypothetical protein V8E36_000716 [Tilletia maclaganii]